MKKSILICILALGLSVPALAEDKCKKIEDLAEAVMDARQRGVPASDMMGLAGDSSLVRAIVLDSFETSVYSTESISQRVIREFKDKWYIWCIKKMEE